MDVRGIALVKLDLSFNEVGVAGAPALGTGVEGNVALKHLVLQSNGVGVAGAVALGKALAKNKTRRSSI